MSEGKTTVLLAGFGGPESLDQVPAFVESVLGRVPPEHVIPAALDRYRTIGGGSPLPGTTRAVRRSSWARSWVGAESMRRSMSACSMRVPRSRRRRIGSEMMDPTTCMC